MTAIALDPYTKSDIVSIFAMTSEPNAPETSPHDPETTPQAPETPNEPLPSFGFNLYAEKVNGRFAMIGFAALMLLEIITHQDFFTWLGLR
ncbi:hypothetical protein [Spirulina major]|uniref:hypothetical protein n=2 Tax=Spirulinaceae TaxID=1890448 RepID=UPI00232F8E50|nr:hypothetical protein [Spirulina major]